MNKIKLLFLFFIFSFLASASGKFENRWNMSPIENVNRYLNNPFTFQGTLCNKLNPFVQAYYDNVYCDVTTEWQSDYISLFTTTGALTNANYSASSQPAGSYSDQTAVMITQSAGLSFDIATDYVGGSNGVNVWVDFDDDGVFDNDEKLFSESGSSTHSGTITIPPTVVIGEYRMRVRAQWNATDPPACGQTNYGSTIDFTLAVVDPPACMPVTALAATPLTLTSAELSWTSDGNSFELEWGESEFTLGTGTLIDNLTTTSTTVTTVIDTPYQFYVRQDCGADGFSLWAGPFSFETGYCTPQYINGCSNGAKISNFQINDAIINLSNNTGTDECGLDGYNDFTMMNAAAPAEMEVGVVVGVGSYSGAVKLWIDWNNNGEFETTELMAQSTATIDSGSSFTSSFVVPAGTALGNYRMRVRVVESTTTFTPCSEQSYGETEDYTFIVIEEPDCLPPSSVNIQELTQDSIEVAWTANGDETAWQVLALPAGSPAPTASATGFETANTNPYVIDGLSPSTSYDIYVRANCGSDGTSLWVGPVNGITTQVPEELDYSEDFEGQNGWTFTNQNQTNKWVVGTAVSNGGTHSLYVSNDEGVSNAYTISNAASVAHAIRDIVLPDDINAMGIGFDWRCVGESSFDRLRVWLVPATYQPASGVQITAVANQRIQIGGNFSLSEEWQNYYLEQNVANFAGQTIRVVFEWRNDTGGGNQPPAAVDNINLTFVTCPVPTNIESTVTCQLPPTATITWTPGGDETQWEYLLLDPTDPSPTDDTAGTSINENTIEIPNLEEGAEYVFWVRAVCGAGDTSTWVRHEFSSFASPVAQAQPFCADEGGAILFPNVWGPGTASERDEYGSISCLGSTPSPVWYFLQIDQSGDLDFQIIQNTQFDADGNPTGTGLDVDFIAWGPFTSLENACTLIDLDNPQTYEVDCSFSAAAIENFSIENAQSGQFYVLLITNYNGDQGFIKLEQTNGSDPSAGTTDCSFLCDVELDDDIIVCEGTEVVLTADTMSTGGQPGQENNILEIRWFKDNVLMDPAVYNELVITVTESGTYRIEVVKENCTEEFNFDEVVVTFVSIFSGEVTSSIELCDIANDLEEAFDLDEYLDIIGLEIPSGYNYSLHETMQNANSNTLPISGIYNSPETTLYLRVQSTTLTSCYVVIPVNLVLKEAPQPNNIPEDQIICNFYKFPILLANQKYVRYEVKNEFGSVTDVVTTVDTASPLKPGFYEIYFETITDEGCIAESSFNVTVIDCILPKGISPNGDGANDYLDLTNYMVQEIKIFNRYGKEVYSHGAGYKREWNGQDNSGNLLPTGTYYYNIITPFEHFTGYIYLVREVK